MAEKGLSRNWAAPTQTAQCRNAWVEVLPVVFRLVFAFLAPNYRRSLRQGLRLQQFTGWSLTRRTASPSKTRTYWQDRIYTRDFYWHGCSDGGSPQRIPGAHSCAREGPRRQSPGGARRMIHRVCAKAASHHRTHSIGGLPPPPAI